jgi:ABC-type thiamin/hydroxymethylpyrimidine transport system permease subunit
MRVWQIILVSLIALVFGVVFWYAAHRSLGHR